MNIIEKRVKDLKPYEKNPRKNDDAVQYVANSIKEFGFRVPIVIDSDNTIVCGHTRWKASKLLKMETVPCVVADDLTEEQIRAYRLADNRVAEKAEWDLALLDTELAEIETIDMTLLGFDDKEEETPQEVVEDDFDEEPPAEPIAKYGDIYQLGRHRLMCGDSTKTNDVECLMGGHKADMVFTDPPYNALKSWKKDEAKSETRLNPNDWFANDNMTWEEYGIFLENVFQHLSGHSVYICCDFRIYPIILEHLATTEYDLKHCIVWKKNVWGLGKRYRFQHEFIVYACKDKAPFFGDRSQSDVWEVDVDRVTEHKTPKPIKLCSKAIINSSEKGNNVLDLFCGGGATLMACEQTDRSCFAMELDPKYIDVIINRWETFTGKKAELINGTDKHE